MRSILLETTKFSIASFLLILLCASNAFAFESVQFAIREICGHMQGNLGGLLMTTAGIGGIVAAAFGNLRASHSLIVVGIGAAALSGILSLYFPRAADLCHSAGQLQAAGNGAAGNGTAANGEVANGIDNNIENLPNFDNTARTNNFGAAIDIAAGRQANFGNTFTIPTDEPTNDLGF